MLKAGCGEPAVLLADIEHVLQCITGCPSSNDTLCCGDLGNIEFLYEAGSVLGEIWACESAESWMADLVSEAERCGDYRWVGGKGRFSLGLFRGLAGVGYTALRRLEPELPNVLIWE
jgi:lantibiotic modifying enzyme